MLLIYFCATNTLSKMANGISDDPVATTATVTLGNGENFDRFVVAMTRR